MDPRADVVWIPIFSRHRRPARPLAVACAAAALSAAVPATPTRAVDRTYVGGPDAHWSDPTIWSPAGTPTDFDTLTVNPPSPTVLTIDAGITANGSNLSARGPLTFTINGDLSVHSVVFSASLVNFFGNSVISVFETTGTALNPVHMKIGPAAFFQAGSDGTFTYAFVEQTGGLSYGGSNLVLDNAYYTFKGGAAGARTILMRRNSVFTQAAGRFAAPTRFIMSPDQFDDTSLTLNGGFVEHGSWTIGSAGRATVNQTGGTVDVVEHNSTGGIDLGVDATADGAYNLSGGSLTAYALSVGRAGRGIFNQTGGNVTITLGMSIAANSSYALTGGTLDAKNLNYSGRFEVDAQHATLAGSTSSFSQAATGTLAIDNLAPGLPDVVHVLNTTQLAGAFSLDLRDGTSPAPGDVFNILQARSLTGRFTTYDLPVLSPGLEWAPRYTPTNFSLAVVGAAVPEPAALAACAVSLPLLRRPRHPR